MLRVAFRTDSSNIIGTGHVMRCLTLASALRKRSAHCIFICRAHDGDLRSTIVEQGFKVLTLNTETKSSEASTLPHSDWLGCSQNEDALATYSLLQSYFTNAHVHWMVVDHYAIDALWHKKLEACYERLLVIDDLADRSHRCDLLLDQTLGRLPEDYKGLLPQSTTMLLGSRYALLRPEFTQLRNASLSRRANSNLKRILVNLGGVDKHNITKQVLDELDNSEVDNDIEITVVMGPHAPWLDRVKVRAATMRFRTEVLVNVNNMACLMARSDLAIGAAGATSWERCALGLPSIIIVIAKNQIDTAQNLALHGAVIPVMDIREFRSTIRNTFANHNLSRELSKLSEAAAAVTSGDGTDIVVNEIINYER